MIVHPPDVSDVSAEVPGRQRAPRVSIGLPVYNGERYLEDAIESILRQTYTDLELILCDNASTDRTEAICRHYASIDPRVRYHRNDHNLGAAPNFNRTFHLSRGEFFKWAAYDDVLAPEYLEACVAALDQDPGAALAHSRTKVIDRLGREIPFGPQEDAVHWDGELLRRENLYDPEREMTDPDPIVRMRTILLNSTWFFEQFGVVRRSAMQGSPLMPSYVGGAIVFMAAMALKGSLIEVDRPLFLRRYHPEQSEAQDHSLMASWMDSKNADARLRLPGRVHVLINLVRLVLHADLSLRDRCRGLVVVLRWVRWLLHLVWSVRHERGIFFRMKWFFYRALGRRVAHGADRQRSLATALPARNSLNRNTSHG